VPAVWLAGGPWLLVARRYGRRFYLPLLVVIIVCLSLSMAPTWPQVAAVVFLLAWSILGAGVARGARGGVWGAACRAGGRGGCAEGRALGCGFAVEARPAGRRLVASPKITPRRLEPCVEAA